MVVYIHRETPIRHPKYCHPNFGQFQEGTPNFGKSQCASAYDRGSWDLGSGRVVPAGLKGLGFSVRHQKIAALPSGNCATHALRISLCQWQQAESCSLLPPNI